MADLKNVEIDEIEMCLNLFKAQFPERVKECTYSELANLVSKNYQIVCTEQDIRLIHEPDILDEQYDMEYFYRDVLGIM